MNRRLLLPYLCILAPIILLASLPGNTAGDVTGPVLLLNEICPRTAEDGFWVELHNPNQNPAQIAGLGIRFFAGGAAVLPSGTPDCPAGGFVLLRFGESEAAAVVRDSIVYVDIKKTFDLDATGDGALLIIDGEQIDAIAWGKARHMSSMRLPLGPPLSPSIEGLETTDDLFRSGNVFVRKPGSWPPSSKTWVGSRHWSYMSAGDASPGRANPAPGPQLMHPVVSGDDGSIMNPRCTAGFIRLEGNASMGGFPGGEVLVLEELTIEQGHSWDSAEFAHNHTWELSSSVLTMALPHRGNITSSSAGSGHGQARVTIKIEPDGRYRMVTDVQPRQGTYRVTASGAGMPSRSSTHPLFFGFGDHHYDYVSPQTPPEVLQALHDSGYPNVFEGQVESPPEGGRVIRGDDRLTLPRSITGTLTAGTHRTWEIWIELPPDE